MYETIPESLLTFLYFIIVGIFLALLYEPLRIFRLVVHHKTWAYILEDTLFLGICSVLILIFSIELGEGSIRVNYIVAASIGAFVYFCTVGRIINIIFAFIFKVVRKFVSFLLRICTKPVRIVFGIIVKYLKKMKKFFVGKINVVKKRLHFSRKMMYNNSVKEKGKEGEPRNVIKAKIRY